MIKHVSAAVIAVALLLSIAVGGAFAFADFQAAESETNTQSQVSTSTSNHTTLDLSGGVYVHVVGDEEFPDDIERALVAELQSRSIDAESAPAVNASYDRPVLFVGVQTLELSYNPVAADGTVSWRYLYAQPGNVTQFGESSYGAGDFSSTHLQTVLEGERIDTIVMDSGVAFIGIGEFTVEDETDGILSLPAYDRHVRTALVQATVDALLAS
jgi:hypothetical protein